LAIARAALREPNLPVATLDGPSREIRLLVDHREDLVAMRTRMQNRLRWHLHELEPGREPGPRCLDRYCELDRLAGWLDGCDQSVLVRLASELVGDIRAMTVRIYELDKQLAALVRPLAPQLLALPGCGVLTAAKIIGEVGTGGRFRSESCFAMHAGVAPVPASSGKTSRHRLSRGGNRQLNAALHRIALSQIRHGEPGSLYYQRRRAQGDTTKDALRALKRRLGGCL
jgi:transposase